MVRPGALATVSGALRSSGRAQVLVMSGARLFLAQDSVSAIDGDAPSVIALGGLEVGEDAALTVADVQILCSGEWDVLGRLTLTGSRVMLRPSRRELLQAVPQHLWGDLGQAADGDVGGLSVAQGRAAGSRGTAPWTATSPTRGSSRPRSAHSHLSASW